MFSASDLLVDHRRLFRVAVEQHDEERRKHDYVQCEEVLRGVNAGRGSIPTGIAWG